MARGFLSNCHPIRTASPRRRIVMALVALVLLIAVVGVAVIGVAVRQASLGHNAGPMKSDKGANQKITLYWASGGGLHDIDTLDPAKAQDVGSIPIVNTIFDQLVTLDATLNPQLWGADGLTISADGLSYTFHLRPGQQFVDGTPVKASDYAFAINRSVNPCVASPTAGYLTPIKDAAAFLGETCGSDGTTITGKIQTLLGDSIVADDSASTLTIALAAPTASFETALTYPTASAVERSALPADGLGADGTWTNALASGTGNSGMFQVKRWDHAGTLVLVPNPHWWGVAVGKKPNFTEVDYKIFADTNALYHAYQSDPSAAFAATVPSDQIANAKGDADFKQTAILLFNGFAMNFKIKPFDNKDARLAFCEAINRDTIATSIAKGLALPTFHIVPQGMPGYNSHLKGPDGIPTTGDLSKAQAHWNAYKATLHGAPVPPITLSFNLGSAAQKASAQYYQATWNAAFGLDLKFAVLGGTILTEEDTKTVQLFRFAWLADYPDPQDFLTLLFDTTAPYNNSNVSIPAADQLMERADTLFLPSQQAERLQLYNQAEQLILDDGGFCPTTTSLNFYALRPWVHGMAETAQTTFTNEMWVNGYLTAAEPRA